MGRHCVKDNPTPAKCAQRLKSRISSHKHYHKKHKPQSPAINRTRNQPERTCKNQPSTIQSIDRICDIPKYFKDLCDTKYSISKAKPYLAKRIEWKVNPYIMRRQINLDQKIGSNTWELTMKINKHGHSFSDWLTVKQSEIPNAGLGLFASRRFNPGDVIGVFMGEKATVKPGKFMPYQLMDIDASKGQITNQTKNIDISNLGMGIHFANDPFLSNTNNNHHKINCSFHSDKLLICQRRIEKDKELFVNYGKEYHAAYKKFSKQNTNKKKQMKEQQTNPKI